MSESTIYNTDHLTKEQVRGEEPIGGEQFRALMNLSYTLLDFFDYIEDKDVQTHPDDFGEVLRDEIVIMMKNIKDVYYELHPHRIHQKC